METLRSIVVVTRNDHLWLTGALGPTQWIYPASLTGSADPDFAIEGCGAGDTICFSVISDIGGRWHAVPFEYGYGRTLEVNGQPAGHLVQTVVDACSCATRIGATGGGAFMEPSGRNRWQPVANGTSPKTAQIGRSATGGNPRQRFRSAW